MFCRYSLRTTDLAAARRFYADAVGLDLPEGTAEDGALEAWPLHERAIANGAPAHWLGHLSVASVEAHAEALERAGGQRLGPTIDGADGIRYATLRDPQGAIIAVRNAPAVSTGSPVCWRQLITTDAAAAAHSYHALFGWTCARAGDLDSAPDDLHLVSVTNDGPVVAGMSNTARRDGVHVQWLYAFAVQRLTPALDAIRHLGGTAMDPGLLATTNLRLAVCEDPQGAQFAVAEAV